MHVHVKRFLFLQTLENTFIEKLQDITQLDNLTPEQFGEMHDNGTINDPQVVFLRPCGILFIVVYLIECAYFIYLMIPLQIVTAAHDFGLILQQLYVKKIIELYELKPEFLNTNASTFCNVFDACQFVTTLPPTTETTPTTVTTTVSSNPPPKKKIFPLNIFLYQLFIGYLPYLPGIPSPWNMMGTQPPPAPDMEAELKEVKAELVRWTGLDNYQFNYKVNSHDQINFSPLFCRRK